MLIMTSQQVFLADDTGAGEPVPLHGVSQPAAIDETASTAAVWLQGGEVLLLRPEVEAVRLTTELDADVRCLRILSEEPLVMLVGTEPAHLYRVTGDGSAEGLEGFDQVDGRSTWDTPWGGPPAVRSLADVEGCLYADIHVGSIVRSSDNGETWEPVESSLHRDVHQVVTCPTLPSRVYANTADAVWISDDRGDSWRHCVDGVASRYGRALAVHSADPDLLLASISRGPHGGEGRLYRSEDGGFSWRHVTGGFPPFVEGNIDTFCVVFGVGDAADQAWAAESADLYRSDDRGVSWRRAWSAPQDITALACPRGI
jgi:hypothetical protein